MPRGSTRSWRAIRLRVLRRDAYTCNYCGATATEVDHIVPVAKGGDDDLSNLVAACKPCNRNKSDKMPGIFLSAGHPAPRPLCSLSPTTRNDPPKPEGRP